MRFADRFEQPPVIEPMHPFEGGLLDRLEGVPQRELALPIIRLVEDLLAQAPDLWLARRDSRGTRSPGAILARCDESASPSRQPHWRGAFAIVSGPSKQRIFSGMPYKPMESASAVVTQNAVDAADHLQRRACPTARGNGGSYSTILIAEIPARHWRWSAMPALRRTSSDGPVR